MNVFTYMHRSSARFFAGLAVFSLLMGLMPFQAFATVISSPYGTSPIEMVDICHSTPTAYDNGIKVVNVSAILATHSKDTTGGVDGKGDIIPPFYYTTGGGPNATTSFFGGSTNWNDAGIQEIWKNDCDAPTVTDMAELRIVKNVVGGTKTSADWTMSATASGNEFDFTDGGDSTTFHKIAAGLTYAMSESSVDDYKLTDVSCDGGQLNGNDVTLAKDDKVTCTFTNTFEVQPCEDGYVRNEAGQCVPDERPTADVTLCKIGGTGVGVGGFDLFLKQGETEYHNGLTAKQPDGCLTISDVPYGTYTFDEVMPSNKWINVLNEVGTNLGAQLRGTEVTVDSPTEKFTLQNMQCGEGLFNFGDNTCSSEPQYTDVTLCKVGGTGVKMGGWTLSLGEQSVITATEGEGKGCEVIPNVQYGDYIVDEVMQSDRWINVAEEGFVTKGATVSVNEQNNIFTLKNRECAEGEVVRDNQCVPGEVNPDPVCRIGNNLLQNGSFEDPVVGGNWGIFNPVANWVISLSDGLELWANGFMGGASDGDQNAELDGNSPTMIAQSVATIPGATYELRFDFSARPDADSVEDNSIDALVDGVTLFNVTADGTDIATTTWTTHSGTFVAASTSTEIAFEDMGTPNSVGSLMDNAVLCLVEEPEPVEACSLTVISDTTNTVTEKGDAAAIVVANQPGAWVGSIANSFAAWIWGDVSGSAIDPQVDETQTFVKTFGWSGPVTSALLDLTADNYYSVKINGNDVATDLDEYNYQTVDSIDVTSFIQPGMNTIEIAVTNKANGAIVLDSNPAGLLYNLTIVGNTEDDCSYTPDDNGGDDLSCQLSVNDNSIRRGDDVVLSWKTNNAVSASLNQEIGDVASGDLPDGSHGVDNVRSDTTYTMTVVDESDATATCSVSVDVRSSGGGGSSTRRTSVEGESDSVPTPQVLGEQVSVVPLGAADAGAGGTAPLTFPSAGLVAIAFLTPRQKHA